MGQQHHVGEGREKTGVVPCSTCIVGALQSNIGTVIHSETFPTFASIVVRFAQLLCLPSFASGRLFVVRNLACKLTVAQRFFNFYLQPSIFLLPVLPLPFRSCVVPTWKFAPLGNGATQLPKEWNSLECG